MVVVQLRQEKRSSTTIILLIDQLLALLQPVQPLSSRLDVHRKRPTWNCTSNVAWHDLFAESGYDGKLKTLGNYVD